MPTSVVELALEDPGSAPTWLPITDYVRGWGFTRGRNSELDTVEPGTGYVRLDNRDGRFDPLNASGPYYPNVVPMRRMRIRTLIDPGETAFTMRSSTLRGGAVIRGGLHELCLFTGYVENWPQEWAQGFDASVTVPLADAFKAFELTQFLWGYRYTGTFPNETPVCGTPIGNIYPDTGTPHPPDDLTGTRVVRVLDCMGWPAEDRSVAAGTVTLLGSDGTTNVKVSGTALQHLLDVAATEGGLIYVDGSGRVVFLDATFLGTLEASDVWGDVSTEKRYRDIAISYDDSTLWNDVTIAATALSGPITRSDTTSITRYLQRSISISLLFADGTTLIARADAYLARYKDPTVRVTSLKPKATTETEWLDLLNRDLWSRLVVRKRPPSGGMIEQTCRIERVSVESPDRFELDVTWELSS